MLIAVCILPFVVGPLVVISVMASAAGLDLAVSGTWQLRVHASASGLGYPAELLEKLLAVGYPPGDLLPGFGRQEQNGPGHQLRRLAPGVVYAANQVVEDGSGRRHHLGGGNAGD